MIDILDILYISALASDEQWAKEMLYFWSVLDILKWLVILFAGGNLLEFPPHILWGLHLQSFRWAITCLFPLFLCFYARNLQSWHFHLWFHHLMSQCAMTVTFVQDSLKLFCFTSQIVHSAKTICSLVSKLFSLELKSTNLWHQC